MRRRYVVKMVRPGSSGPTGASTSPRQRRCSSGGKLRSALAAIARCCSSTARNSKFSDPKEPMTRSKRQACPAGKRVYATEAAVFS